MRIQQQIKDNITLACEKKKDESPRANRTGACEVGCFFLHFSP